jgi:hypothetical protein
MPLTVASRWTELIIGLFREEQAVNVLMYTELN